MGRAHEVRAASMAKTAAIKTKVYSRYGKEIYIAAKNGVPDPEMNLTLKHKIAEAKANQVPADVIKRAIEKAKGGSAESYDDVQYEGFGPNGSTFIVQCLTDNTNRCFTEVRNCFNKCGFNIGQKGSVSYLYETSGVLIFDYEDEEGMLDALIMADVDVKDLTVEDGIMTVYTAPADLNKAKEAIDELIPNCEYATCEIQMLPNDYVDLGDEEYEKFERFIKLTDACEDIQHLYHNVNIRE